MAHDTLKRKAEMLEKKVDTMNKVMYGKLINEWKRKALRRSSFGSSSAENLLLPKVEGKKHLILIFFSIFSIFF